MAHKAQITTLPASRIAAATTVVRHAVQRPTARFRKDEDGGLTIFSLFLFFGILMVSGLAIDVIRTQSIRLKLQSVADTAVLAAVSSTQLRDKNQVVQDYFAAAGLDQFLVNADVDATLFAPEVTAEAQAFVPASFSSLAGIRGFSTQARASASEMISAVEVSLVLDVSGSMDGSKLVQLKESSSEFVEAIYRTAPVSESHISIIPYAAQVSIGPDVLAHLNVSQEHTNSHCIDFEAEDFLVAGMDATEPFNRAAHFDPYSSADYQTPWRFVCKTEEHAEVLAYSNHVPTLLAKIDSLDANGSTSIDTGMKWGAALLDLKARPVVQGMIGAGVVSSDFIDRPVDPSEHPGIKIVVLMTDGENTSQYRIEPAFRGGLSDVWRDQDTGRMSVKETVPSSDYEDYCEDYLDDGSSSGQGYWRWMGWRQGWRWFEPSNSNCSNYQQVEGYYAAHNHRWYDEPYGNNAVQLTYGELWNYWTVDYHAYIRYRATNSSSVRNYWEDEPVTRVYGSEKDDRLLDICTATKNAGVLVYTIAVEAPQSSEELLEQCATSPSHHFDVDRFDIDQAFGAIITSMTHLRLTQ